MLSSWYATDASLELGHCFLESRAVNCKVDAILRSVFRIAVQKGASSQNWELVFLWHAVPSHCPHEHGLAQSQPSLTGAHISVAQGQALAAWKQAWCSFTNKVCFFPLELWPHILLLTCPVLCQKLNIPFRKRLEATGQHYMKTTLSLVWSTCQSVYALC